MYRPFPPTVFREHAAGIGGAVHVQRLIFDLRYQPNQLCFALRELRLQCLDVSSVATIPIMVTGGIRRFPIAEEALNSGIDMVGMATALTIDPYLPKEWREGAQNTPMMRGITWKNKVLASIGYMAMVKHQIRRLSRGRPTKPNVSPAYAFLEQQLDTAVRSMRYRRWIRIRTQA